MVLSLLVFVVVGVVAYFHYIQGFFSATLSAIVAIIAAIVALSFHEIVIVTLLQGKVAELAHSLVLVALFALTYIILRVVFDSLVPGNVQVPLMLEKIGAGVMGVVAGLFAGGIFAIAAQALPFGPMVGGFARYELAPDETLSFTFAGSRSVEARVSESLKSEKLDRGTRNGLLLPADSIVLNTVSHVSGGALSGAVSMSSVHPDYLDELFFQRLGVETGAKRVAYNTANESQVSLGGLYTVSPLPLADSEPTKIIKYATRWSDALPASIRSDGGNILLVARLRFAAGAADADNKIRLSPASVRLVAGGVNYRPLGTLDHESGPFVRAHRPDDFLFLPLDGVVDFVFYVPAEALGVTSDVRSTKPWVVAPGPFIEAKRLGSIPLAGKEIVREDPGIPQGGMVMRKTDLALPRGITARPAAPAGGALPGATPDSAQPAGSPIDNMQSRVSGEFISPINVGRYDGDIEGHQFAGNTATIRDKKFAKLEVDPGQNAAAIAGVEFPVGEMWVPTDHKLVQISGVPAGEDPWVWATRLGEFSLVDSNGEARRPNGAWAKVKLGTTDTIVARYDAEAPVPQVPKSDARPTDVWIVFVVPDGTALQEIKFGELRLASVNIQVE